VVSTCLPSRGAAGFSHESAPPPPPSNGSRASLAPRTASDAAARVESAVVSICMQGRSSALW
jgi:hypothetical protein